MGNCSKDNMPKNQTNLPTTTNSNFNTLNTTSAMLNTNNINNSSGNPDNGVVINAPVIPQTNIPNSQVSKLEDDYKKLKKIIDNKEKENQNIIAEERKKIEQLNENIKNKDKEIKEKLNEIKILNSKLSTANNELKEKENEYIQKEQNFKIKENEFTQKANNFLQNENIFKTKENEFIQKTNIFLQNENNFKIKEKEFVQKTNEYTRVKNEFSQKEIYYISKIDELQKNIENLKAQNKINESYKNKSELLNNETNELKNKFLAKENKYQKVIEELNNKLRDKEPNLVGLNNIGATCYMNATLQSFSNTKNLSEYFLNKFVSLENYKSKLISYEYYKVVKNLWDKKNHKKSYSPDSFKEKLSQENPLFAGAAANDSKDLINFLLERFHLELNLINPNTLQDNSSMVNQMYQLDENKMLELFFIDFKSKFRSIISDLFYGVMETKSFCQGCQKNKYNFQIYSFV